MLKVKQFFLCLLCSLLLGCANTTKEQISTVAGGFAGGVIGTMFGAGTGQILGIGVGTYAGAVVGNIIGRTFDKHQLSVLENDSETIKALVHDPKKPFTFEALLEKDWITIGANHYCHQYISIAEIKGVKRHSHGVACLEKNKWIAVRAIDEK